MLKILEDLKEKAVCKIEESMANDHLLTNVSFILYPKHAFEMHGLLAEPTGPTVCKTNQAIQNSIIMRELSHTSKGLVKRPKCWTGCILTNK